MPNPEERLLIVEQTVNTLRLDLLQVIVDNSSHMSSFNKVLVQQEDHLKDADHEITILTGVIGSQGQDIKSMKEDLSVVKSDLSSVKATVEAHNKRFDSMDQRLESVDKKFDQVLLMLTRLASS